MKRRPQAWLFIFALLGAFYGFKLYEGSWLFWAMALSILLPLLRIKSLSIISVLFFTFFITAQSANYKTINFLAKIPKKHAVYYGQIIDVSKKRDATVALAKLSSKDRENFTANIIFSEALRQISIKPGQEIIFSGTPKAYEKPLSKVHFDAHSFGLSHGLHASFVINKPNTVSLGAIKNPPYFANLRFNFIEQALKATTIHEASLLLALMIGDTKLLSTEQIDTYKLLGIQHLLAVSGLQITLLSNLAFFILVPLFILLLPKKYLHYSKVFAALVALLLTFWFVGLCGFTSSAQRAFLMGAILLLPTIWPRNIDIFDAFYVSGFISILIWPESVLDLGFLLSYAAVFSLLVAHHRSEKIRNFFENYRLLSLLLTLLISSVAAFLGTLPIIAATFQTIAPFSILANMILVPVASILQIPAILLGLLGSLLSLPKLIELAVVFANLIEILSESIYPYLGKMMMLPDLSPISLFSISLAIFLLFLCVLKRSRLFILALVLFLPIAEAFDQPLLKVVLIPVGQGDSTLFMLPSGENILIDAGGQPYGKFDPGHSIVLPTLRKKGVKKIDVLIITHPDPDHVLGAFALIKEMPIKEIWHSGFSKTHPLTTRLMMEANKKNILVRAGKEIVKTHVFNDTSIEILAPDHPTDDYYEKMSSNNNSLVLRISYGGHKLLWPGDLEIDGEKLLLASRKEIYAQILKAPHHGSKTSSHQEFIDRVSPQIVLYSTGTNNRFGFPHQQVVDRYQAKNIASFNTGEDGEIIIKLLKDKRFIESYRKHL